MPAIAFLEDLKSAQKDPQEAKDVHELKREVNYLLNNLFTYSLNNLFVVAGAKDSRAIER